MKKKIVIILLHSLAKQKAEPEKPEESRDSNLNFIMKKFKIILVFLFISILSIKDASPVYGSYSVPWRFFREIILWCRVNDQFVLTGGCVLPDPNGPCDRQWTPCDES
jgi:hypothetical protein